MDFFGAQDNARRKSVRLYVLFGITVAALIGTLYAGAALLSGQAWNPGTFTLIATFTLLLISAGSLYKIQQLNQGGSKVARLLGGRQVLPDTDDPAEQRLLNVVEEMAIASGIPVPAVYVMDNETSINAFAAGMSTRDAVIGVTRGSLNRLTRDELQGVIAHEFSHIFNGDMRINLRLIGLLNGLMLIHLAGMILVRFNVFGGGRSKEAANARLAFMAFGLLMIVLGYIGVIFGRIIQAAISRQREYLADASAVQYTRNPDGLAGALDKIRRMGAQQKMKDANATEMSHLFFSQSAAALFSTHPPLHKRIKALKAAYMLDEAGGRNKISSEPSPQDTQEKEQQSGRTFAGMQPEMLLAAAGNMQESDAESVRKFLQELPEPVRQAMRHSRGAAELICALVLSESPEITRQQLKTIREADFPEPESSQNIPLQPLTDNVVDLQETLKTSVPAAHYLILAELSLTALRTIDKESYDGFRTLLSALSEAGGHACMFELCVELLVIHHLEAHFSANPKARKTGTAGYRSSNEPDAFFISLSVLLSAVSHAAGSGQKAKEAWEAGQAAFQEQLPEQYRGRDFRLDFMEADQCSTARIKAAVEDLADSGPVLHKQFLLAAARAVTASGEVSVQESRLLHALAASLDIPLPFSATIRFSGITSGA